MRCPFPGMDPYLERREIWPDFHDRFITYIGEALQPLLRPRYAALTEHRLYVVEHERPVRPDVSVVRTSSVAGRLPTSSTAVLPDSPLVIEIEREEIVEPLIHIVEPAAGNRIVTAIEVLSPDNKQPGSGRDSYLRKREELWQARVNLVEVDLLRGGEPTVRVSAEKLASLAAKRYVVAVTRLWPSRCEVYAIQLAERLSRVALPLANEDPDVVLDLEAAFERCWDAGPYPELLGYGGPPPGDLTPAEVEWCLRAARPELA